ncbi:synaptic vesicle 2-related protein-like isoform X2 [Tachypleus tridentatus]|uniref:synaptic vesicle 2-related protein-like isoform X2 n=1 Tax=Tachypleus tridentatus TaxID=6853 RepID=UPI003FD115DA
MKCFWPRSNNDEVSLVTYDETDSSTYESINEVSKETSQTSLDSYTVEDVVNAGEFGKFQWKLTFLCCFAWVAESCELMVLSLLGGFLACEWQITSFQVALLTSTVFLALGIGSPIWGKMADKYGRRKIIIGTTVGIVICGIITVVMPNIEWMIAIRGLLGFFLHGMTGVMVLYVEYLPTKMRGKYTLFFFWCPESARYLLTHGKVQEAEDIMIKMAKENKISLPSGNLQVPSDTRKRKSFICLINDKKLLFFCLLFLWFSLMFVYYGIVLLAPQLILHGGLPVKTSQYTVEEERILSANLTVPEYYMSCKPLLLSDYVNLLWTTAAETFGVFFAWLFIEPVGRRKLMFIFLCFYSASVMMLLINKMPPAIPHILQFIARGSISACVGVCMLYTNEVYPTTHRAMAFGLYLTSGRIGAIITPFVAQVLMMSEPKATVVIYSVLALLTGISTFALPFDKTGQELEDQ